MNKKSYIISKARCFEIFSYDMSRFERNFKANLQNPHQKGISIIEFDALTVIYKVGISAIPSPSPPFFLSLIRFEIKSVQISTVATPEFCDSLSF